MMMARGHEGLLVLVVALLLSTLSNSFSVKQRLHYHTDTTSSKLVRLKLSSSSSSSSASKEDPSSSSSPPIMSSTSFTTSVVDIEKPDNDDEMMLNVILGQTHFIKTVDDIHEAMVGCVPDIQFGLGFCEASGERLVRYSGTNNALIQLAKTNAQKIACGHAFILFLGPPVFPLHVLNTLQNVPEVCRIFCATANPLQVIVAETDRGRGILGVIDGQTPVGVETEQNVKERRELLKQFGYKL